MPKTVSQPWVLGSGNAPRGFENCRPTSQAMPPAVAPSPEQEQEDRTGVDSALTAGPVDVELADRGQGELQRIEAAIDAICLVKRFLDDEASLPFVAFPKVCRQQLNLPRTGSVTSGRSQTSSSGASAETSPWRDC